MRPRPLHAALLLIAAAAIMGPLCAVSLYNPVSDYQALAEASCKCARLKPDKAGQEGCWQDFDAATRNARANASATSCLPLSETIVELPGGATTTIHWESSESGVFCTREEAISAEALYASIDTPATVDLPPEQQSPIIERAVAALEQLSHRYARGERVTFAKAYGCVSGYDHSSG